jgi:hypothetical protein
MGRRFNDLPEASHVVIYGPASNVETTSDGLKTICFIFRAEFPRPHAHCSAQPAGHPHRAAAANYRTVAQGLYHVQPSGTVRRATTAMHPMTRCHSHLHVQEHERVVGGCAPAE